MAANSLPTLHIAPALEYHRLNGWERFCLAVLAVGVCFFAFAVEMRSAFFERRRTDADVFFRASWAVRSGADMYRVTDDNDWHYNYPPFLAIVMLPLADAPHGLEQTNLLPYPVSIALWFVINLVALVVAVHWLARAVERSSPDLRMRQTPWGCQEWWRRRMLPFWLCLLPAAHSLMRGQVNLVVLLLFTGMIVCDIRGRKMAAGAWLAVAISIKVIPAFLLVYPLWRRDWRFLGGCAVGLLITLAVVPGVVLGPERTAESYVELVNAVLRPGLTHRSEDSSRAKELTNITSTDNQSFVAFVHYNLYPDPDTRPEHVAPWLRWTTMAVGGLVTLLTLLAAPRRRQAGSSHGMAQGMLAWGTMLLVMLFCSPMSHSHYYCWCVPLLMGLLALRPPRGKAWLGWMVLGTVFAAGMFLPHPPVTAFLRDYGVVTLAGVVLWCVAVVVLAWETWKAPPEARESASLRVAA